jgi:hypothetical protein
VTANYRLQGISGKPLVNAVYVIFEVSDRITTRVSGNQDADSASLKPSYWTSALGLHAKQTRITKPVGSAAANLPSSCE